MAPKKKEQQKMSLGDFLQDQSYGGSWADEVEDTYTGTQALPAPERAGYRPSGGGWGSSGDRPERRDYGGYSSIRENLPQVLPDKPPYTAHLGNLSYDATVETVNEFFEGCNIVSVRIIEDREQQRPKGFAYAEFGDLEGLKQALTLDGQSFQGRMIKIKIADPPRGGDRGESTRDISDWTRKGPLPDLPGRGGNDRRGSEFGERRGPREPREPREDDGKVRDFGNWERRGPLSPIPREESGPREGSRPRTNDGPREFRNRHQSPAAWGEGQGPRQDSRPPRPERVPTAAEKDNQWRSNMRPDAAGKSSHSRDGSEAPPSPALSAAAPVGRPRLNLAKRTVSEAPDVLSPSATDSKASPFGAARPIDTAAKERAIEEKKQQQAKEKREADEKAKEERRLAKEAAAKEAAEAAEKAEQEAAKAKEQEEAAAAAAEESKADAEQTAKADEESKENGATDAQNVPVRTKEPKEPKEPKEAPKSRANDSINWRSAGSRGAPTGPRRGGPGGARGGRGDGPRPPRSNGGPAAAQQSSAPADDSEPAAPVEDDGWTTVPKGRRNAGPRGTA